MIFGMPQPQHLDAVGIPVKPQNENKISFLNSF
jgi:hypothetical protein